MKKNTTIILATLTLLLSGCAGEASKELVRTPYKQVTTLSGDLLNRLSKNYERLQAPLFSFDSVSTAFTVGEAPGDWIGRDILSQSILCQVLHRDRSPLFVTLIDSLPTLFNEQGYIGPVRPDTIANEGQITGHNGLLRGLNEYYLWTGDAATLAQIQRIVDNLFLKRAKLVKEYPSSVLKAQKEGGQVGHTVDAAAASHWQGLSTDIGQFFLTLDALSQTYEVLPSPELNHMIRGMIDKFTEINFAEIGGQTHSFLGCLRGILKWYRHTGEAKYLELVIERFAQYQQLAMTENFENYNWFDRPLWTEGCAVVDAFMLSTELWRLSGNETDLHLAHLILYNGIYPNQRPNGGFGCNNCTGAEGQLCLQPARIYEAPWCCTMRGSEALVETLSATFCHDRDRIVVPFYHNAQAHLRFPDGELTLAMTTDYPYSGKTKIEVLGGSLKKAKQLQLFIPSWADESSVQCTLNGGVQQVALENRFITLERTFEVGDVLELDYTLPLHEESTQQTQNADYRRFFHGPLLLGAASRGDAVLGALASIQPIGAGLYRDQQTGTRLTPISEITWLPEADSKTNSMQILFER